MKLELVCTFLVVVLLVVIVYTNTDKVKVIDLRGKESFGGVEGIDIDPDSTVNYDPSSIVINGSQSDLAMGDIITPDGSNTYTDYLDCEDYTKMGRKVAPNDMLRATTSQAYSKYIVYDDYTPTTEELSAMTGLDIRRNAKNKIAGRAGADGNHGSIRTFEHDSKSL